MKDNLINRIKKYNDIYIIGHKNPDADSIFSSLLLKNILIYLNINAYFTILDDYTYSDNDTKLINDYLKEKPIKISKEELKNKNIILVDHNDPEQSIGSDTFNIICSIDHHIETNKVFTLSEVITSTALYIYSLFKDIYKFNEYEKELIALATMTDSEYLTTTRYQDSDKLLYNSLNINLNVNEIREKYFVTTNFSIEPQVNINNNYKVYNIDNISINRTMIKAYEKDNIYIEKYLNILKSLNGKWIMIWNEYDTNKTYIYIDNKLVKTYNYIITSSVVIIRELKKENIL